MKPLRLGIAGLGEAATEFLPAYSRHPGVVLTACADSREIARKRFERDLGGRAYERVDDLCADPDLDVIVVATVHEYHKEPTILAAEHGKHVIVEKPIALDLEDCDEMIDACERNGVHLLAGHNHSFDAPIRAVRELVESGELGALRSIASWNFNDFMVRPYPDEHLRHSHGVVLNQGAHHVDIARLIGGGLVRSVRATTGAWDPTRPAEGAYSAFLEFEDGTPCTLVYSGYGYFDTAELFGWLGEGGAERRPGTNARARRAYTSLPPETRDATLEEIKERRRFGEVGVGEVPAMPAGWEKGGRPAGASLEGRKQPFFGLTLVSCERGDIRQTPDGLRVYGEEGERDIDLTGRPSGRQAELDELIGAVVVGEPVLHDGRWAKATVEACLAIVRSAGERRELPLAHQVPLHREEAWRS